MAVSIVAAAARRSKTAWGLALTTLSVAGEQATGRLAPGRHIALLGDLVVALLGIAGAILYVTLWIREGRGSFLRSIQIVHPEDDLRRG